MPETELRHNENVFAITFNITSVQVRDVLHSNKLRETLIAAYNNA